MKRQFLRQFRFWTRFEGLEIWFVSINHSRMYYEGYLFSIYSEQARDWINVQTIFFLVLRVEMNQTSKNMSRSKAEPSNHQANSTVSWFIYVVERSNDELNIWASDNLNRKSNFQQIHYFRAIANHNSRLNCWSDFVYQRDWFLFFLKHWHWFFNHCWLNKLNCRRRRWENP